MFPDFCSKVKSVLSEWKSSEKRLESEISSLENHVDSAYLNSVQGISKTTSIKLNPPPP
jgi:hypothetical protein